MNRTQKLIVTGTLFFEAWLFHHSFNVWRSGEWHRAILMQYADRWPDQSGMIVSLGPCGMYARRPETVPLDSIMGIGIPVFIAAIALLVYTLQPTNSRDQKSHESAMTPTTPPHKE